MVLLNAGHYALRVLFPTKVWQRKIIYMPKERDQDVKRLGTVSYEGRLKRAEGFALGRGRYELSCLHIFEELSYRRGIRLVLQGSKG